MGGCAGVQYVTEQEHNVWPRRGAVRGCPGAHHGVVKGRSMWLRSDRGTTRGRGEAQCGAAQGRSVGLRRNTASGCEGGAAQGCGQELSVGL